MSVGDETVTFAGGSAFGGDQGRSTTVYRWQSDLDSEITDDKTYEVTINPDSAAPASYAAGDPGGAAVTVTDAESGVYLTYQNVDSS